ncbi:MAG: magnesium transporter CorA family protein, partial [Lachnospiraceae bacterium]|nr:magnesium transporter CorA family protein [Lachnospiraceae bacterium]
MMKIYRTDDQHIHEREKLEDGVWVQLIQPSRQELEQ